MDQLFMALPSDLQWEVLSEFVGTHAVRKGKLMRKLVWDINYEKILDMPLICPSISAEYDIYYFYAISVVIMSNGRYLAFGESPETEENYYGFRRILKYDEPWHNDGLLKRILLDDSVALPPFEKHSYPSYEETDKKKKRRNPT
jgi:hypothetical protein